MTLGIEIEDVRVTYGDVVAVDGLTVRLDGGKIHGLLGRNGSGKSSLLAVVAAFRKPASGEVRIGGASVFENPEVTRNVCLIREAGDTVDKSEKVSEALRFAEMMRATWNVSLAERLVERFGLDPKKRIDALSRGQRSALGVTLGMASRSPVTIFDESYLGMDAPSRYVFYEELLADFIEHPRTFVISTHLIEEVASLFEEVVIIDEGRLVVHEQADALRNRGVAVTGPAEQVDRFVDGLTVLGEKQLGRTKSATVYGDMDDTQRRSAMDAGLDIGPVPLQDLFVHLTQPQGADDARH